MNTLHASILAILLLIAAPLIAQSPVNEFGVAIDDSVRLESLHTALVANWPLARRISVANQIADLNLQSIAAAWLPELNLSASAQYQTDVTEMDLPFPGAEPRTQPKDRYALTVDVRQMLYDGGATAYRRDLEEWSRQVEKTAVDVDLYTLSYQLNDAFFSALILKEQEASLMLFLSDVDARLVQLEAAVASGSVLPVQADVMRVEKLKVEQRMADTRRYQRRAYEWLSILSGVPIDGSQPLARPVALRGSGRPETTLFQARRGLLDAKKALSRTSRRPVVSAFAQAAYANPGLDIFADEFGPYAIVGVTAKWSIWDRGLSRRETTSLTLQQRSLAAQEDALRRTWSLQAAQHQAEIDRLSEALRRDAEILALRTRIVETYASQLENGSITATDYLTERNAAHQADVQMRIHQWLLLQAKLARSLTLGE